MGLILCGLNGSGKSTLGRALAEHIGWHFIDNEDLYFPKADPEHPYASERTKTEIEALLLAEVRRDEHFVFAAVRGDYGEAVQTYYRAAVLIEAPREIRMARVKARSYARFGERMLPGGDLCESEQQFFDMVAARPENYTEQWLARRDIPVLRVDGTKPIGENVVIITEWLRENYL